MKGKAADKQIARIRPVFAKWIPALGLDRWCKVDIRYYAKFKEFQKDAENASRNTAMMVWTDWRYLTAMIAVNLPTIATLEDDELENAVVHELMHIYVDEMGAGGKDHEERTVSQLTQAFLNCRDAAKDGRL